MLGLIDRWYAFRKCRQGYRVPKVSWEPEIVSCDKAKTSWFCFVPSMVSRVSLIRRGLIPAEGQVFVYTLSSLDLITADPEVTVEKLHCVYDHALEHMQMAVKQGKSVNLLGVSLGNVLSIRLAGQARTKIINLISIIGGGNLGLSCWDSILTGYVARQSVCATAERYEEMMSVFSPVSYIREVEAERVVIRLGTHDLLIPFRHGEILVDAFVRRSQNTSMQIAYKAYRGADHASAMFFSSLENLWRSK